MSSFVHKDTLLIRLYNEIQLGDACHPMMPYMAQGAAQATEDAATIAAVLREYDNLEGALKAYEKQRLPRATHVAKNTRILQAWWHLYDGSERSTETNRCGRIISTTQSSGPTREGSIGCSDMTHESWRKMSPSCSRLSWHRCLKTKLWSTTSWTVISRESSKA